MKAAENFEKTSVEETFDENLFIEFMKKVAIWDYFAITKQNYLSLSEQEKRDKISKYYSDMKSRKSGGKHIFVYLFFLFEIMSLELTGLSILREELEIASREANELILQHCFYCKNCRACFINSSLQKELKRNNFKTKNKHVKWWRLHFVDDLPALSKNL